MKKVLFLYHFFGFSKSEIQITDKTTHHPKISPVYLCPDLEQLLKLPRYFWFDHFLARIYSAFFCWIVACISSEKWVLSLPVGRLICMTIFNTYRLPFFRKSRYFHWKVTKSWYFPKLSEEKWNHCKNCKFFFGVSAPIWLERTQFERTWDYW